MRVCEKGNLSSLLERANPEGGLLLANVLHILHQVIAAVSHLHKLGIIHRDIRSANILVDSLDPLRVVVADFGLSHLLSEFRRSPSAAGQRLLMNASKFDTMLQGWAAVGPIQWSAPEVCAGDIAAGTVPATTASDTYMLGGLLFELLTCGMRPFFWLEKNSDLLEKRRKQHDNVVVPGVTSRDGVPGLLGKHTVEAADIDGVEVAWCVQLGTTPGSDRRLSELKDVMLDALSTEPSHRPSIALLGARVRRLYEEEIAVPVTPVHGSSSGTSFSSAEVEAALTSLGLTAHISTARGIIEREFGGRVTGKTLTLALIRAQLNLVNLVRLRSILIRASGHF
jgi:serine/threonine protein kinase